MNNLLIIEFKDGFKIKMIRYNLYNPPYAGEMLHSFLNTLLSEEHIKDIIIQEIKKKKLINSKIKLKVILFFIWLFNSRYTSFYITKYKDCTWTEFLIDNI